MKNYFSIFLLLFFLASCAGQIFKSKHEEYQSISESEWEIQVTLFTNGEAFIKQSSWSLDHPTPIEKNYSGSWKEDKQQLRLIIDQVSYDYQKETSLILYQGAEGPGLKFIKSTRKNGFLSNINLWKKPINFLK